MLKKLFLGIPRKIIITNTIITLIWSIMNSYLTVALSKVAATQIEHKAFIHAACFFIVYILLWEMIEFICDYLQGILTVYVQNYSYSYYYQKLYTTKPEELQKGNTGYVAGILTQLIEKKSTLLFSLLITTISLVYIIYLIVYIAQYSLIFSGIIIFLSFLSIVIRLVCSKKIAASLKNMTVVRGEQTRIFMDGINNISTVQKLRGLSFIQQKATNIEKKNLQASRRFIIGNEIGFTVYKTINYMIYPICMFVALEIYQRDAQFPIVQFLAYLSLATIQLVFNNRNIANFIKDFTVYCTSQKEMDRLIREQSSIYTSTSIGADFHEISIQELTYQYGTQEEALKICIPSFVIQKGEKICIMGESGQGKTTLLKILSGIIETKGNVYVDGIAVDKNIDAVFIAQDTEMLDLTLRENLTFGNPSITDEQLYNMLKEVGMWDWFEKQEEGLDTLLGERGVFVSTGQRQRLNVIRGLLIDKEIYLLDEPTSNLDEVTEERIIAMINHYLKQKTVIIVTHKEKISHICNRKYEFIDSEIREVKEVTI
ncbi:ATP-binding cassette domain-containing protein [Anaerosporobacter faecicola]|uniref:ATP-binding cassette domain-containing protein n=1 Tax=Anaerosporobacter faecicola TaxID=2718714 RepID=UPI00143BF7E6|nr:ABC transporter ATP-binding protein [Anaerosporobacter faecicola]